MLYSISISHVGNSAASFGEMVRNSIFIANRARAFCAYKNLIWHFVLNFVSFVQAKENKKIKSITTAVIDLQKCQY